MNGIEEVGNEILQQDIQAVIRSGVTDGLRDGSTVFVTGATGLIGSLLVKALVCCDREITVVALARSMEKAQAAFGSLLKSEKLKICLGDVNRPLQVEGPVDYIIHGASPTSSKYFVEKPVETIFTALNGTRNVLELAKEKQVKKAVYLSSLEVYGVPEQKQYITEQDFGSIDPMQVRSSYSEGKRMAECVCASYAKEYGVPVVVARLCQTFGAGVAYDDGRVFAQFARCAIEGRDIVLHTQGNTVRTYCYTSDAITALLTLMLRGVPGEAYNVTNMQTAISIRDMAELVCSLVPEKNIQVRIEIPEDVASFGYNPEMIIRLDSGKLQALGWQSTVDLKDMFTNLIKSMTADRTQ